MTARTPEGKVVGTQTRHYHPQATNETNTRMLYGAQVKAAYLRDTSLQPYETRAESFELALPEGTTAVDVIVDLFYELGNPEQRYDIHRVTERVNLIR